MCVLYTINDGNRKKPLFLPKPKSPIKAIIVNQTMTPANHLITTIQIKDNNIAINSPLKNQ
jgi:hypothetical protein